MQAQTFLAPKMTKFFSWPKQQPSELSRWPRGPSDTFTTGSLPKPVVSQRGLKYSSFVPVCYRELNKRNMIAVLDSWQKVSRSSPTPSRLGLA